MDWRAGLAGAIGTGFVGGMVVCAGEVEGARGGVRAPLLSKAGMAAAATGKLVCDVPITLDKLMRRKYYDPRNLSF
jgi:hypothetical protein